jgi:hypothetical protein
MKQMIRKLKRQVAGENLKPEQLKGMIRAVACTRMAMSTSHPAWAAMPWSSQVFTRVAKVAKRDVEIVAAFECGPRLAANPASLTDCCSNAAAHYLLPLRPFVEAQNSAPTPSLS